VVVSLKALVVPVEMIRVIFDCCGLQNSIASAISIVRPQNLFAGREAAHCFIVLSLNALRNPLA
jgi:hypothetical protein